MMNRYRASALTVLMLIAGLSSVTANAAKRDGFYFEDAPFCCETGVDIRTMCCTFNLSTADAAITNGVLKLATNVSHAIYTDGTYWISNGQFGVSSFWSAGNGEALRKDFADWPTYRVKMWFYPTSQCTGYLTAYSSRGKLIVQKTFTSSSPAVLDTGAQKGRIGFMLATFDGECGRLGKIGYYHRLR